MRRMAATQEQRHSLQEREKRSEEIIIRDNEDDQQDDDITIANKRARTTASTISPASSPSTIPSLTSSGVSFATGPPPPMHSHPNSNSHDVNHYHNTGHTHHINNIHGANNNVVMDQRGPAAAPDPLHPSNTVHINYNIISGSIPVSVYDSDLLPVGQPFIDKCRSGQYNDLTQLLPRKRTRAAAASSSSSEIAFTFDAHGNMKKSTELTELLAPSGQKRHIDSFARLAEVMVHILIGQVYKDDVHSAATILQLFSLAITLERMHGWNVAQHYVEAALDKRYHVPSFNTREIDPALYSAALSRSGPHSNSYRNHSNNSQSSSNISNISNSSNSSTSITEQICNNYNKFPKCKWGSKCHRKHICSICGAGHSALQCSSSEKGKDNKTTKKKGEA